MHRAARALVGIVAAIGLVAGCSDDDSPPTVLDETSRSATIEVGDDIAIEIDENPSVGDEWEAVEGPDEDVISLTDDTYVPDEPQSDGSGGTRKFRYQGEAAGTTEITYRNCFRCDADGNSTADVETEDLTFTITVTDD